jgi:hypothetical protein
MRKKERDEISLVSPPSLSLEKEKRTSSISDLLCLQWYIWRHQLSYDVSDD